MFPGSALFVAVLSSLSLAQAASSNGNIPQCAANCMSIKITEAAAWFGAGEVSSYCKHPEFLLAYNNCLHDNCKGDDVTAGKQAGIAACAGVTPNAGGPAGGPAGNATVGADLNNSTTPLPTPANATGNNSTVIPIKSGTNPSTSVNVPTTVGLGGTLPPSGPNATSTATSPPSRFSGAVASAATNASSQASDATAISSASALLITAISSCALSLLL